MGKPHFAHLHLHTQYSILDGAIPIRGLIERCQKLGMPAVAMTDHGNMFGAVHFHQTCVEAGVKPIIGSEVYVAQGSRFEKDASTGGFEGINHLVLLAMDERGYRNLIRLVSKGYLEGFYYKPRIDFELLAQHSEGLIATSGCLSGAVPNAILAGRGTRAWEAVERYSSLFKDRYYLELQRHGLPQQDRVNAELLKMHRDLGLPLLATNDAHYLGSEDSRAHDALLCVQTGKTLDDPDRFRFDGEGFYVKGPEEMGEVFHDLPAALANTVEVAERCSFELETGRLQLPEFAVPGGQSMDSYLRRLAREGLGERLAATRPSGADLARYEERLRFELDVIERTGFSGYFLIVWDFTRFARERGIPVGPGRGSSAGSLVSYALRITGIDPIEYGIPFERFLNPERVSMPDIDVDFCMNRRGEVIRYVEEKYNGEGDEGRRVAGIVTFGTMAAKAAVRDVGRVMGMPFAEVDRVAKLIPTTLGITLREARQQSRELRETLESTPRLQELFDLALAMEGQIRNPGRHAAGIVISSKPLLDQVPLYRDPRTTDVVTQFDWRKVEDLGMIKFDLLGLRTLTIITDAVQRVRARHDPDFDIEAVPLDDGPTYDLLCAGDTDGIFQVSGSTGNTDLVVRLQPRHFRDVIPLLALYRPGPLQSGMVEDFVNRRHGRTPVTYPLPELEAILAETYGIILYQDQVLQIANSLASFTLAQGDLLRRAMGKKIPAEMEDQRSRFLEGCRTNGHPNEKAERIFDLMYQFAGYGFNKAHSAAYGLITHQTAYLKAHYPAEFYAACMTAEWRESDRLDRYVKDAARRSIQLKPPDVNESEGDFTVTEGGASVRFGLSGIKHVGEGAVEAVIEARREGGPFRGLFDFVERVDSARVNRRVLESLVRAGAFDFQKASRAALMELLPQALERGQRVQRDRALGQGSLFGGVAETEPTPPEVSEWPSAERLRGEKEMLGFYVTGHPLQEHRAALEFFATPVDRIGEATRERAVRLGGLVSGVSTQRTKRGDLMARAHIEDLAGTMSVVFFPESYDRCAPVLRSGEPVILEGQLQMGSERTELVAARAFSLDEAWQQCTRELRVALPAEQATPERLRELLALLEREAGPTPVALELVLPDASAELELRRHRVAVSPELVRSVDRLCGQRSARCIASTPSQVGRG